MYYKFDENINGPGVTVINHATATSSTLNGITYSNVTTSPYTTYSCFNYTDVEENISATSDISIFPNPNNGKFIINSNNVINKIEIYNVLGECVYNVFDCRKMKPIEINLSDYPNGIYFVKIYGEKNIYTEKIIVN